MSSVTESVGGNVSTSAPTLDLHEIQATVLRPRPAPYFGAHVLLRIDDARAGREFLRRLAPHIASADELVECGECLAGGRNQLCGPRGARASEGIAAKLPRGVSRRHGRARQAAWRRWGQRSEELGQAVRHGSSPYRRQCIQRFRGKAAPRPRGCSRAIRGLLGRQRARHAGLRRAAGRSQFARLQRRHRPAGDRGQRRRAAAWLRSADQGRRVHPWLSGRGRDSPADAAAGHPRPQRHLCRLPQISVARRRVQSIPSGEWQHRGRTGIGRREAGRPLAQRRTADAGAGRRQPGARRGPETEQRLRLRERSAWPAGAVRMPTSGA